jgi:hypothetical protein
MMYLDIPCKAGKLQVTDEGVLRVLAPFNRIVWSIPCANVTRFTTQVGMLMSVNVTIYTAQGNYQAEMVTSQNFAKLQALFPHLETQAVAKPVTAKPVKPGKEWYHNPTLRTHIASYTSEKQMQKEVEAAGQFGWIPQGLAGTAGHINVGRTLAAASLTGGLSLLLGASRTKDKITITYVRTPEWLAENQ